MSDFVTMPDGTLAPFDKALQFYHAEDQLQTRLRDLAESQDRTTPCSTGRAFQAWRGGGGAAAAEPGYNSWLRKNGPLADGFLNLPTPGRMPELYYQVRYTPGMRRVHTTAAPPHVVRCAVATITLRRPFAIARHANSCCTLRFACHGAGTVSRCGRRASTKTNRP
jgi:hypothetical protein